MSQHASLRVGGKIRKKRNVMKRFERLNVLRAEGRITEEKVYGLPKTKPIDWSRLHKGGEERIKSGSSPFLFIMQS